MKLYVKHGRQRTIREFVKLFFERYSVVAKYYYGVATYNDEECTQVHCHNRKLRSFDDLLIVVNTYYKNVTAKKLIDILVTLDLKVDGEPLYLHCGTCSGIMRIRMCYCIETQTPSCSNYTDNNKYNSIYSWKELLEMLNIKSKEEYLAYNKKYRK